MQLVKGLKFDAYKGQLAILYSLRVLNRIAPKRDNLNIKENQLPHKMNGPALIPPLTPEVTLSHYQTLVSIGGTLNIR